MLQRRTVALTLAGSATAGLLLVGCSPATSNDDGAPTPSASPSPTSSLAFAGTSDRDGLLTDHFSNTGQAGNGSYFMSFGTDVATDADGSEIKVLRVDVKVPDGSLGLALPQVTVGKEGFSLTGSSNEGFTTYSGTYPCSDLPRTFNLPVTATIDTQSEGTYTATEMFNTVSARKDSIDCSPTHSSSL